MDERTQAEGLACLAVNGKTSILAGLVEAAGE